MNTSSSECAPPHLQGKLKNHSPPGRRARGQQTHNLGQRTHPNAPRSASKKDFGAITSMGTDKVPAADMADGVRTLLSSVRTINDDFAHTYRDLVNDYKMDSVPSSQNVLDFLDRVMGLMEGYANQEVCVMATNTGHTGNANNDDCRAWKSDLGCHWGDKCWRKTSHTHKTDACTICGSTGHVKRTCQRPGGGSEGGPGGRPGGSPEEVWRWSWGWPERWPWRWSWW